mmetsp:Transcript_72186/g.234479  ORF Transcript_72186/g.234479 Transcript_72186/m.234479 type:complete len:277 (-) Transcript_72186:76-906(-)
MVVAACASWGLQEVPRATRGVPDGLSCKNTFFELAAVEAADLHVQDAGPATCPLPTEGWWAKAGGGGTFGPLLGAAAEEAAALASGEALSPLPMPTSTPPPPGLVQCTPDWAEPTFAPGAGEIGPTPEWFGPAAMPQGSAVAGASFAALGGHFAGLLVAATASAGFLSTAPASVQHTAVAPTIAVEVPAPAPLQTGCGRVLIRLASELGLTSLEQTSTEADSPSVATTSGGKGRRRRGCKEKEVILSAADPFDWLPTATRIDLSGLERIPRTAAAC